MQVAGSDGGRSGGSPRDWTAEVTLRISQEAKGAQNTIPSYFGRFEAITNEDHPSIFKRRHSKTTSRAAAAPPLRLPCLPGSSNPQTMTAPPPQELARAAAPHTGSSASGGEVVPGQLTAPARDVVVVAAVGPYHLLSPPAPAALITRTKKCGIVVFLARRFGLDAADFLGWARRNEARVRGCYERDSLAAAVSVDLAEMLLLDGCVVLFAVFLLRTSVCEDQRPSKLAREVVHGREFIYLSADISLHMKETKIDLLMLHNQIPFFVLAELHRRLKDTLFKNINHSLEELALSCFDDIHPSSFRCRRVRDAHGGAMVVAAAAASASAANNQFPPRIHHLLHLFHWSRVPMRKHQVGIASIVPKEPERHLPCATELEESLVRFRKQPPRAAGCGGSALDISFQRRMLGVCGEMSMPELCVHKYSDCVFRNLIAFEQNYVRCDLGVTAYCLCMARLLQSEADVKVLRKRGVLVHTQRTDREIVEFFRDMRDEYGDTLMPEDLLALCRDVGAHRRSKARGVVKGILLQCFPRQTVTFFVIFGAVISIATLINTVHTMYRYYHPYKGRNPSYGP